MARPVEDSDDEFPDLAVVIGKHKRGAETKATRENPTKKHATKAVPNQAVVISTARLQSADLHMSPENLQCSKTDFQKPKSKRRVLNKICDNPLLRPFDHQKESTASLSSSKMSELKLKSLLAKSKVHKESKATGRPSLNSASEEEELSMQDSTGLSDFVVDDSSIFDEDSTDEDVRPRPPRSTRRLVRGRRPPREDSSEEEQSRPRKDILNASKNVNMQKIECSSSQDQSASRDLDEPLALLSL